VVRSLFLAVGGLAFFMLSAATVADQPDPLDDLMPLIAEYPKSMREDILFLSSHLKLLAALAHRDSTVPLDPMDPLLKGWPPNVQKAALHLAKEPEVLKALQADPEGTFAMGQIYLKNRSKVLADLQKEEQQTSAATEGWAKRLGQDADAIEQMTAATAAYHKQLGGSFTADDAANFAGVELGPNQLNVTALPNPEFVEYVMNNADAYPALSNSMVSQWLGSRNSWAYDRTFQNWWGHYRNHFNENQFLAADGHRVDRLGDLARYDRKFSNDEHRWDKFDEHRQDFQRLAKQEHASKNLKQEAHDAHFKPNLGKRGEHHPAHKPEKGKHPVVKHTHPSEHKHTQHAARTHAHHAAQHHAAHHGKK
jgi:hypothetical protein